MRVVAVEGNVKSSTYNTPIPPLPIGSSFAAESLARAVSSCRWQGRRGGVAILIWLYSRETLYAHERSPTFVLPRGKEPNRRPLARPALKQNWQAQL